MRLDMCALEIIAQTTGFNPSGGRMPVPMADVNEIVLNTVASISRIGFNSAVTLTTSIWDTACSNPFAYGFGALTIGYVYNARQKELQRRLEVNNKIGQLEEEAASCKQRIEKISSALGLIFEEDEVEIEEVDVSLPEKRPLALELEYVEIEEIESEDAEKAKGKEEEEETEECGASSEAFGEVDKTSETSSDNDEGPFSYQEHKIYVRVDEKGEIEISDKPFTAAEKGKGKEEESEDEWLPKSFSL